MEVLVRQQMWRITKSMNYAAKPNPELPGFH
jgi:hypothetical protein